MNKKKSIIFATSLMVVVVGVSALTSYLTTRTMLKNADPAPAVSETTELSQAEVLHEDTGEVLTYTTGGTATINTESGESIDVIIANDQYDISADYLSILAKGFGTSAEITADNLVITGDKPSVTQSVNSINAAPFSDIFDIYCQIYGEEFEAEGVEGIWSPAYTYMKTGELPEGVPDNYIVEDYSTINTEGIEWKLYNVNYDTDTTQYLDASGNPLPEEEVVPTSMHTQFLVAYSNTEDAIEIMCYEENNNPEVQLQMIKDFLGAN